MSFLWDASPPATGGATTMEDFEDATWPGDWSGSTGAYSLNTTTPLDGSVSLDHAGAGWNYIGNATLATPRDGTEYRIQFRLNATNADNVGLLVCSQDETNPFRDCYFAFASDGSNFFDLGKRNADTTTWLHEPGYSSYSLDTTYQMGLTVTATTVQATLYDAGGAPCSPSRTR